MAAVIHIVKPQHVKVFGKYTAMQIQSYLESQMIPGITRVYAVLDTYIDASFKSQTLVKRDETAGRRKRVSSTIPLPKRTHQHQLLTTDAELVLSNIDLSNVSPCHHEEADTRMMLHLCHAVQQGHTNAYIRTVDSDDVVLATNLFGNMDLSELWI